MKHLNKLKRYVIASWQLNRKLHESCSPIVVKLGDMGRMFHTAFYWSTLLYTTSHNTYSVSLRPCMENVIAVESGYRESMYSWDETHYFLPECTVL